MIESFTELNRADPVWISLFISGIVEFLGKCNVLSLWVDLPVF